MAAYVKATDFAVKDGLITGNPAKVVTGAELDAEFNAIALSSQQNYTAITTAETNAAASAAAAATSESNASTSASTATTQASAASTSATNAASSATSASTSASTATTQASNASTSATNAANSATAASTSETNAGTSAANASTSETNAANSATSASTSETNASNSAITADNAAQSVAIKWTFSTTTTMADPGSGIMRFNNATPASVTAIAVDDNNSSAQDVSAYVVSWDDSTGTNKGTLTIKQGTSLAIYTITALTDNAGWTELAVTYVTGAGSFSDATATYATFIRTGNQGAGITEQTVGFTATGGTTPKTLTVDDDLTTSQAARRNADNTLSGTQTMSGKSIIEANASVAAHATTMNPWLGGNYVTLTGGAVTFTDMAAAPQAGAEVELYMNAAHVFTDGAVFEVDGNANYTAAIGDRVVLRAKSTTVFTVHPRKADGTPIVSAAGGSLVYLSTVTASAAATVDIETGFSSTYDDYVIIGNNMSGSAAVPWVRVTLKIGGSYLSAGYDGHIMSVNSVSTAYSGLISNNAASAYVTFTGNGANDATGLQMNLFDVNSSKIKAGTFSSCGHSLASGVYYYFAGNFGCRTPGVLSGVRLTADTGTLNGTYKLYGIAKA